MQKKLGIKIKVAIITTLAMSLLTIAIGQVGYVQYSKNVLDNYVKYAQMVIGMSNEVFLQYGIGDMVEKEEMPEAYEQARQELNKIKSNADIKYLYSVYFKNMNDLHSISYVINAKSDVELNENFAEGLEISDIYSYMGEACEEDAFAESTLQLFYDCISNWDEEVRYEESTTDEYGHLVTCYRAIFDHSGKPVAILGADIDVNKINSELAYYVRMIGIIAICLTVVAILLFMFYIQRFIVNPVAELSHSADKFVALMNSEVEPEQLVYDKLKISTKDEIKLLSDGFTGMAEGVKHYMKNLQTVTAEKQRIGTELELATKIQANMLPNIFPAFPERDDFDIYASMTPAKEVGGDFYDFFILDDDHLGLVIADVSGKGVPAALFMMMSKILVSNYASIGGTPGEVLTRVNDQICKNNEEDMFVTVWFGILTISTGHVIAANAGHEYPMLKGANGEFQIFKDKHGFVVGGMEGVKYKDYEFTLEKGGTLFVYTDGVAEATNTQDELFGTERMLAALNQEPDADPKKLLQNVRNSVDAFVGDAPQFDDLTMLAVKLV